MQTSLVAQHRDRDWSAIAKVGRDTITVVGKSPTDVNEEVSLLIINSKQFKNGTLIKITFSEYLLLALEKILTIKLDKGVLLLTGFKLI